MNKLKHELSIVAIIDSTIKKENNFKKSKGITLIALVITIVILLILAGVTITNLINNGIVEKTDVATEETRKQLASEIMNLKITNIQMSSYVDTKKLPTLQYLADKLCIDSDIEYVLTTSKALASCDQIIIPDGCSSIFTKLNEYPYEFEINSSMQLASIDGVKIADVTQDGNTDKDETFTLTQEQYDALINKSMTIDITSPSTLNVWVEVAEFPEGFNFNNCYIDYGYLETFINGKNCKYSIPYFASTWGMGVRTTERGIELYVSVKDLQSVSGKIVLTKY